VFLDKIIESKVKEMLLLIIFRNKIKQNYNLRFKVLFYKEYRKDSMDNDY
jgi:hypothetical protein